MSDYLDRYAVLNVINDAIANNALSYEGCVNKIMESIAKIPSADVAPARHGQMTNADRIRSLSDEELAERLAILTDCVNCPCRDPHDQCDTVDKSCQKQWLDWLKKEVTT